MAPIPDANTVAARWATGLGNARQKIIDGVQAVTVDPGQRAIANGQAYINGVQQAFTSGKWQRGLQRSGLEGWRAPMLSVGADRAATGASANQGKFADRIAPVLAFEANLQSQIRSMPNVTIQDKVARATAWINGMHQFGQQN